MTSDNIVSILTPEERAVYKLRALYTDSGYSQYKMSKFEEYDFYTRNKDFLISENIITFTDGDGRLLALKPDVTLSIIKNTRSEPGQVQRLCYNENVYRTPHGAYGFREIMQVGVECVGDLSEGDITDCVALAARSLSLFSEHFVLEVSNLDILTGLFAAMGIDRGGEKKILAELNRKSREGVRRAALECGTSAEHAELLASLCDMWGKPEAAEARMERYKITEALSQTIDEFCSQLKEIEKRSGGMGITVDLTASANTKYYNGISFRGYIEGIPSPVLSGGRYDRLLERMKKSSRGIGFAVYLNELTSISL